MSGKGFWRWFDRGARVDFAGTLLGYVFDWKGWVAGLIGGGGGATTFLKAAIDGWSPLVVWVMAVVVAAALSVFVYYFLLTVEKRRSPGATDSGSTTASGGALNSIGAIPDVRAADDLIVWRLFESSERDKLFPLLEEGRIQAWGRLGNGFPPLMKIPAGTWRTNYIERHADPLVAGRINQTFLKPTSPHGASYYDVCLNRSQLKTFWPKLWEPITLYEAASLTYGETRGTVISDMAEHRSDSPLFWYVFHFFAVSKIPVYGRLKFSSKREQVPTIKGYTPQLRDNQIILKEIYGSKDWENLTVDPADLIKDLESLRKTASEVP
jgi:hypothetical protein